MCEKTGNQLADVTELLLRQVRSQWLEDEGQPSSQAFWPFRDNDECCLSTDRGSMTTAEASHQLFTSPQPAGFGDYSAGVWGLLVSEVESAGTSAWEDPVPAGGTRPANPCHAVVEFGDGNQKQHRKVGKQLKVFACARGKLHPLE